MVVACYCAIIALLLIMFLFAVGNFIRNFSAINFLFYLAAICEKYKQDLYLFSLYHFIWFEYLFYLNYCSMFNVIIFV